MLPASVDGLDAAALRRLAADARAAAEWMEVQAEVASYVEAACDRIRTAIQTPGQSFEQVASRLGMTPDQVDRQLDSSSGLDLADCHSVARVIGERDWHEWFARPTLVAIEEVQS